MNEEVCEAFRPFLQLLRGHSAAIKNSSLSLYVHVDTIGQYSRQFCFPTHQKLLEYLSNELLPTFDVCRRYEFNVSFRKDANHAKQVIASLLALPAVERCSNVAMVFRVAGNKLPLEAISHWLNFIHPNDGDRKRKERFLSIQTVEPHKMISSIIPTFEEVVDHLKKVNYIIFVYLLKLAC